MSAVGKPQRLQSGAGRPLKGAAATTSTERNRQRIDRLAAVEAAVGGQKHQLATLTRELADSCLGEWAGSLAHIATVTALEAIAGYTRRNSQFFVTKGPAMLGPEARAKRITRIEEAAVAFKALASQCGQTPPPIIDGKFQGILTALHNEGFYPDASLVSDVGMALHLPGREEIARRDQLRRTVMVCVNYMRNLAFYSAGWISPTQPHRALDACATHASFLRQTNGNFLDICVLEWCKLFVDQKAGQYWENVVSDPRAFNARLLTALGLNEDTFQDLIGEFREYRDNFVVKLGTKNTMQLPVLDIAAVAVRLFHRQIVTEASSGDLRDLLDTTQKLNECYEQWGREAQAAFSLLAA